MKRTLLPAVLALALGTGVAFAQAPIVRQSPDQSQAPAAAPQDPSAYPAAHRHHPEDPNKQAARLAQKLNLTADQQAKVAAAFADRDQKIGALHANTAIDEGDMHKQQHRIRKDTENQLSTILTPDQLQQMKSMQHEHGGGHHGQMPPAPPQA